MLSKEEYERKRNEKLARLLARVEQAQSKGEGLVQAGDEMFGAIRSANRSWSDTIQNAPTADIANGPETKSAAATSCMKKRRGCGRARKPP